MKQQGSPYRFTSPALQGKSKDHDDSIMYECPVGYILREAPFVYDLLDAAVVTEHAGLDFLSSSRYLQHAVRLISSEKSRTSELRRSQSKQRSRGSRDSSYAAKVLRGL